MAGPSLHLMEFVCVPQRREGDGAAVFVTSCDGPGKCVPMHQQNVPWGGSSGQEWAWKRRELTLLVALALRAMEFWGVCKSRNKGRPAGTNPCASDRLPIFLQPCMGGWMAPVFIVTVGLIERGLICGNLLHFISITGR